MLTSDQVTEYEVHKFEADASDLGIKPGEWPVRIQTAMGNKLDLVFARNEINGDDVVYRVYRQEFGCMELRIWND